LARARGHGLGLVGAVQHIGQVRPDLRMALMSEARSKVILQPAADDAAVLARHLPGVEPADLLGLPARQALAAVVVGGRVVPPVTIATAPPPEPTGLGDAARMVSARAYGRDRAQVERDIAARRRGPEGGPRRRTRRIPE
jgi:DNA helicase HerA-like ATPase